MERKPKPPTTRAGLRRSRLKSLLAAACLAVLTGAGSTLQGSNRGFLFYFEAQAVAAWDMTARALDLFSLVPHEAMQNPSLGFDSVLRLRRRKVDMGYLAVQARLAYDQKGDKPFRLQLFNAFLRLKTKPADLWAGHNKPAFGLAYGLDNHALLLPDAPMTGVGFDRDWGVGAHRDLRRGDVALSLTAGSGMALRFDGGYLVSVRISRGVAVRDNYNFGLSLAAGRVSAGMGSENEQAAEPSAWQALAVDGTYFWRNLESRLEVILGRRAGGAEHLVLFRQGLNLLQEARLKLEAQAAAKRMEAGWRCQFAGGAALRLNADLTLRAMLLRDGETAGTRLVFQLYYYRPV